MGRDSKDKRTIGTGGKFCLIFLPEGAKKMLPISRIFIPGVPPLNFYSVVWENIPGDSVTPFCFILEKILDLFRTPHLELYFYLVLR